ncbi:MAG: alpha-1,4-glucan--maltose-1-phosphate maltosyltransferase [Nocardioidaceae bacterium]|nr:alpha-1,4-glucan--maltose-1-phosphate maltosyltransferase [Nocardioidaceae bacterium]MCL2613738.1 alpha-1,4-glucan--maltose-1-phosphate maltosyltransferase [Nocardioidaceae bacterium]
MVGRIPVTGVVPVLEDGRPVKAAVGEPFPVGATVFREGHDRLGAEVVLIDPAGRRRPPVRMEPVPAVDRHTVDRYAAWVVPDSPGDWSFEVHAWSHPIATWQHAAGVKIRADIDTELMFREGEVLLRRVADGLDRLDRPDRRTDSDTLDAALAACVDDGRPVMARLAVLESPEVVDLLRRHPVRELVTVAGPFPAYADRPRALCSSWYELFPRSEGGLAGATERLDAIATMGFDVVYLPPIHPIGEINRKGPNNTVLPDGQTTPPDWPGSPWAIGSRYGGHDAVAPELGTIADFDRFVARAGELGMEVALDLALQCAPDHPWVAEHPEWFTTRVDGSIAYAENPPKKYQDIYPLNFDNDPEGIRAEVLRVVRHWMAHGVRIFRVDNPHTKPVDFWEWLLGEIRATDPDVLFLAEAFTKPPMLQTLGAIGFHQSYTYFTWRTEKTEIEDYLREVSQESAHRIRPNFFVNTPDILHEFLQHGGPPAFKIRAVLAATGSPSWGVYSGYELFEHVAVRPGSEEYLDSEKYQVRPRDWATAEAAGESLAPYLTRLNELRRQHPALRLLRNLTVHPTDNDHLLCFSKATPLVEELARDQGSQGSRDGAGAPPRPTADVVIVVVNLDPHQPQEGTVHLDLTALRLPEGASYRVRDELTGQEWTWGAESWVRLDPAIEPAHVLTVRTLP